MLVHAQIEVLDSSGTSTLEVKNLIIQLDSPYIEDCLWDIPIALRSNTVITLHEIKTKCYDIDEGEKTK